MEDDVKREMSIKVQINKNGRNVSSDNSVEIIKSSRSNEFDTEAIIALNDPFEPLPDRFKGKSITIKIDFIYIPKKAK